MPIFECVDDPEIASTEVLWRFVHIFLVTRDHTTGQFRPKSGAFIDTNDRMSVDVASQTTLAEAKQRNPGKFAAQSSCIFREIVGLKESHSLN